MNDVDNTRPAPSGEPDRRLSGRPDDGARQDADVTTDDRGALDLDAIAAAFDAIDADLERLNDPGVGPVPAGPSGVPN